MRGDDPIRGQEDYGEDEYLSFSDDEDIGVAAPRLDPLSSAARNLEAKLAPSTTSSATSSSGGERHMRDPEYLNRAKRHLRRANSKRYLTGQKTYHQKVSSSSSHVSDSTVESEYTSAGESAFEADDPNWWPQSLETFEDLAFVVAGLKCPKNTLPPAHLLRQALIALDAEYKIEQYRIIVTEIQLQNDADLLAEQNQQLQEAADSFKLMLQQRDARVTVLESSVRALHNSLTEASSALLSETDGSVERVAELLNSCVAISSRISSGSSGRSSTTTTTTTSSSSSPSTSHTKPISVHKQASSRVFESPRKRLTDAASPRPGLSPPSDVPTPNEIAEAKKAHAKRDKRRKGVQDQRRRAEVALQHLSAAEDYDSPESSSGSENVMPVYVQRPRSLEVPEEEKLSPWSQIQTAMEDSAAIERTERPS